MSNYEEWQLNCFGNILPPVEIMPSGETENGEEEIRRFQEWTELQNELYFETFN
jgi:hypothetical protein